MLNRNVLHIATKCINDQLSTASVEEAKVKVNEALDYAVWVNGLALKNAPLQKSRNLISLGRDCLGRTLPAKFGLVDTKAGGRSRLPFDLAVHPINSVFHLLRSGFQQYFEIERYSFDDKGMPALEEMVIVFNHEDFEQVRTSNFASLIEKNQERVDLFNDAASQTDAAFLIHVKKFEVWHCAKLLDFLDGRYPWAPVFVVGEQNEDLDSVVKNRHSKAVFVSRNYKQDYIWNQARHFATKRGMRIESEICDELMEHILEQNTGTSK